MIADQHFLDRRIHAPVHMAYPLHKADRIPMDIIIDHPTRVLEVKAFGQHVGRNEHSNFLLPLLAKGVRVCSVIVWRKALKDIGAITLGPAVDFGNAFDPRLRELLEQVTGGVRELGED